MEELSGVILGFDPGGKGRFGWSVCVLVDGALQSPPVTGLASEAADAVGQAREAMASYGVTDGSTIFAAGIDAPLFWSKRGGRTVDSIIRQALRETGFSTTAGTVQHFNSLQGSCVIQGVLLADLLHQAWNPEITEAHPKALDHLLRHSNHTTVTAMLDDLTIGLYGDRLDATRAALAAWAMHERLPGWRNLYVDEPFPVQPFNTPVNYWMPISRTRA